MTNQSFLEAVQPIREDVSAPAREAGLEYALAGQFSKAAECFHNALQIAPLDNLAKGYLGSCLYAMEQDQQAAQFMDCEAEVIVDELPNFGSLSDEIPAYLMQHPTLVWEPELKSTKRGHQSDELLQHPAPILQSLKTDLCQLLSEFLDVELLEQGAPLKLVGWSVILGNEGFQEPHLHRSGLISGVLYISVPEKLPGTQGALAFSQHLPWLPITREKHLHPNQIVTPAPGKLVLFPSHYWHQTIPFSSDEKRISIAFDILPNETPNEYGSQ